MNSIAETNDSCSLSPCRRTFRVPPPSFRLWFKGPPLGTTIESHEGTTYISRATAPLNNCQIGLLVSEIAVSAKERMQCMEIWGGNRTIDKSFEAPGLDIYVHSIPYKESKTGGGDIYYVTSCASGRICRLLLADVSGHGEDVSEIAISLRDLLRDNVNRISQARFVSQMNKEFSTVSDSNRFATAVVATFLRAYEKPFLERCGTSISDLLSCVRTTMVSFGSGRTRRWSRELAVWYSSGGNLLETQDCDRNW